MQKTPYLLTRSAWFLLSLFLALMSHQKIQAQVAREACANVDFGTPDLDLSIGDALNVDFDIAAGNTGIAGEINDVTCDVAAVTKDIWTGFDVPATGAFTIQYSSLDQDAVLTVYVGANCAARTAIACVDDINSPGTESVTINVNTGDRVYIQVSTAAASVDGKLSVFGGNPVAGDICSNALEITTSTCDFDFNIGDRFFNHEGLTEDGSCGATGLTFDPNVSTGNRDGWVTFEADFTGTLGVQYYNFNQDAALEIYSGTCGNLTFLDCANITVGSNNSADSLTNSELIELSVTSGTRYYVRVLNIDGTEAMIGGLCLYEVKNRDNFTGSPSTLDLGDCNVNLNVLNSANLTSSNAGFTVYTTTVPTNLVPDSDGWVTFQQSSGTNLNVVVEYASISNHFPTIQIFQAPPTLTSPLDPTMLVAGGESQLNNSNTVSAEFTAVSGTQYFIRVIRPTETADGTANVDMLGSICIYRSSFSAEGEFYTANTYSTDGDNCGEQFNLLGNFSVNGTAGFDNLEPYDATTPSQGDAWAVFETGAVPTDLIVEYDNDNNSPILNNDVALLVYQGESTTAAINTVTISDDPEAANGVGSVDGNINQAFTLNVPNTNLSSSPADFFGYDFEFDLINPPTERDAWVYLRKTSATSVLQIVYESSTNTPNLEILEDDGFGGLISVDAADNTIGGNRRALFLSGGINDYYIRVSKQNDPADMNGTLTIIQMSQVTDGFSNNIISDVEGIERIDLEAGNLVANTRYYVRVVNTTPVPGGTSPTATIGTLCIRPNVLTEGDICNVAVPILVGDCDVNFDVTTDFTRNDISEPSCLLAAPNYPNFREGWMRFTATSTNTTIEYLNDNDDAAIAVYRGSCGASLIFLGCANDVVGTSTQEKLKINTIEGLDYFIQVINITDDRAMTGRFCVYNTVERDICDDNELVEKFVGDCNIQLDVPANFDDFGAIQTLPKWSDYDNVTNGIPSSFTPSRYDNLCDPDTTLTGVAGTTSPIDFLTGGGAEDESRDAWLRLAGNGNEVTITYQNKEATSDPAIVVYTALIAPGPIDCGLGLNGVGNVDANDLAQNQIACANAITTERIQTETITFPTEAGRRYLVRIMDIERTPGQNLDMTGILCFADGSQAYNTCAEARSVEVGECSVPINIIQDVNDCSGGGAFNTALNAVASNCFSGSETLLIARQSTGWAYEDDGTNLDGTDWNTIDMGYDPATEGWTHSAGTQPAAFGFDDYGGDTFSTLINSDAPGYNVRTYYFRNEFTVDPTTVTSLTLRLRVDDGAVAYIDGNQVARRRMPSSFNNATNATSCIGGSAERSFAEFNIPISNLDPGLTHVLAVEVHNCNTGNRDIVFDAELAAVTNGGVTCTPGTNGGDAWATFTVPTQCTTPMGTPCPDGTIRELPDTRISVQYDNRNFTLDSAPDVQLAVFTTTDCTDDTQYTNIGCADQLGPGEEGIETITIDGINFGETYFVRLVNLDPTLTALGNLCVLYGETQAQELCPPANDYGELNGDFKNFEVLGAWNDDNNAPTSVIPGTDPNIEQTYSTACVLAGGSNPSSNSPNPIRSQGWMSFEVPSGFKNDENTEAVTIQFDNSGFGSGNPQNAALAVYVMPNNTMDIEQGNCAPYNSTTPFDDTNPANTPNIDGLQILGCINSVFRGTESLTIPVGEDTTYIVRVMNVTAGSGTPANMPGRIRVFPFAPCTAGPELAVNGDFDNWPIIDDSSNPWGSEVLGDNFDNYMNGWIHTNPRADGGFRAGFVQDYAKFATDYGYVRDRRSGSNSSETNPYNVLFSRKGELNPEGLYAVSQSPWSYKPDWYCYGQGYSGYGGSLGGSGHYPQRPNTAYCDTGNPNAFAANDEPCVEIAVDGGSETTIGRFGSFDTDRPALIPPFDDANFMIVNGSFNPSSNLPPGKVWCQTVDRGASAGSVSYYIFSAWVQNMISGSRNLDLPQIQMTVCDMQNWQGDGSFPTIAPVTAGTVTDATGAQTRLPGITEFDGSGQTVHNPPVPNSNNLEQAILYGRQPPYGAAMPCNLPGETRDLRLKRLGIGTGNGFGTDNEGQEFLVNERPDKWLLIRCIYKAPADVVKVNICLENSSLTKNGNDFGLDNISFRECTNSEENMDQFEELLKGNACELSAGPEQLRLTAPQGLQLLDFTGKLIGEEVFLDWMVIVDDFVNRYEVERSINGRDFQGIGAVDGKNQSNVLTQYDYVDRTFPRDQKFLYYRLRIQNDDGSHDLSPVIRVDLGSFESYDLTLITNPTKSGDDVEIKFNVPAGLARVSVDNIMGLTLFSDFIETNNGDNSVFYNTAGLEPGIYIISVSFEGKKVTKRLLVY